MQDEKKRYPINSKLHHCHSPDSMRATSPVHPSQDSFPNDTIQPEADALNSHTKLERDAPECPADRRQHDRIGMKGISQSSPATNNQRQDAERNKHDGKRQTDTPK